MKLSSKYYIGEDGELHSKGTDYVVEGTLVVLIILTLIFSQ